jgi:hypothetical protein
VSHGRRFALWMTGAVAGAALATLIFPGHRTLTLAAGVMAVLAILLVEMGRVAYRLTNERSSPWARVRHVLELVERRPEDLERIERRLGWGRYAQGDFNYRVRPLLRRLVAHRLRERHRIDVEAEPDGARPLVSDELWDLVIVKEPPESERVIRTDDIARMVDEIEEMR